MRELIEHRRAQPGDDVLSLLLAARYDDGTELSERELLDQLLTFVVAGHETTATSLAWAMEELHRHPGSLERLLVALGDTEDPAALVKNPELRAVVSEVLRRHPPVPMVSRRSKVDFTLGGHVLPAGTRIGVALYISHNLEESFPSPHTFRPERFLEPTASAFEYMPFGGGARRCLGAAFATYELELALATLVRTGRFRLEEPRPPRHKFRIGTYGPEHGVRMSLARA
jgi:cytochrome P450